MSKLKQDVTTEEVRERINSLWPQAWEGKKVWGVPRGGYCIALMLQDMRLAVMVDDPDKAEIVVDDIIDSGKTWNKFKDSGVGFWAPYKEEPHWIVFPWENSFSEDAEDTVTRLLQQIGEDPSREGLVDTPRRVVKSWKELYAGYHQSAEHVLGTQFTSANTSMVICKDIEFYSMCEHHMLPFSGRIHIGYIPHGTVVGLSKLARLSDMYAKRLQIQEQLTDQIVQAITEHIKDCKDAMVVIEAKHHCMCSRGVNKQNSTMTTSAIRGVFQQPEVRAEFLNLIK